MLTNKDTFDIGLYTPEMNVAHISFEMSDGVLARVLVVGVVYAAVAALIAITVMKKRDV